MLKYIGSGNYMPGIPARDLTEDEVERFGAEFLIGTGLYAASFEAKAIRGSKENKAVIPAIEDKEDGK